MDRILRLLSRPVFWFVAYICWFGLLYFLSEQSSDGPGRAIFYQADKVAHAVYFAGGATGLGLGILLWRPRVSRLILFLVLIAMAFLVGCFDEWHQSMTPGRDGNSAGDVAADVFGGVLGFFLCQLLLGFARRRGLVRES